MPPAALSIHLAIGQAYAWSMFKPPLEKGLGISGVASALPFTFGIIMLGLSAALFGTRVDSNGPRWAMVVSSSCFVSGFLISALGLYLRQYWLVVVGYGFVGGIGLGIGYIPPGFDADQVVPGPSRPLHRHRDHGPGWPVRPLQPGLRSDARFP